jgi:hypothetical protein
MKKFIMGFLTAALLFTAIPVGAAIEEYICYRADYKVMVNGTEYISDDLPILNYKGSTYAPFRSILEAAGLNVNWNAELRQAEVTIAPVPAPTREVETMSEVPLNKYGLPDFSKAPKEQRPATEKEGDITFFTYDGLKYIGLRTSIGLISRPYFFKEITPSKAGGNYFVTQLAKGTLDGTEPPIIIEEIPYALHSSNDDYYITNDYYINTILPLIQGTE